MGKGILICFNFIFKSNNKIHCWSETFLISLCFLMRQPLQGTEHSIPEIATHSLWIIRMRNHQHKLLSMFGTDIFGNQAIGPYILTNQLSLSFFPWETFFLNSWRMCLKNQTKLVPQHDSATTFMEKL